jgi:hypothetical protein
MAAPQTVNDLIAEVRSLLNNDNQYGIDDTLDIIPALNRAKDKAYTVLSKQYKEPLLTYRTVSFPSNQDYLDLPEDAFQDRLEKIQCSLGDGQYVDVERISFQDSTRYERSGTGFYPRFYCIVGRQIRFFPQASSGTSFRIWLIGAPEQLVLSQGRITTVSEDNNYLLLDEPGEDLTSAMDQLDSYVNIIDSSTGTVKGSLQIRSIADQRVTFKTSPTRSTVYGKTITDSLTDLGVEQDDYVCSIKGSCVPLANKIVRNFLIQYAVADIKGSGNDEGAILAKNVLDSFEKEMESTWVGREITLKVKRKSKQWGKV